MEVAPFLLKEIHFMKQLISVPTLAWLDPQLSVVLLWKLLKFVRYILFPLQETYKIYKALLSPFSVYCLFLSPIRPSNQHEVYNISSAFLKCQQ